MVLATKTSAPNTSLAVIRPKPRPDSPTASEISVIMLKSELLHEAPNPVSKKAPRVHHAYRSVIWRDISIASRGHHPSGPLVVRSGAPWFRHARGRDGGVREELGAAVAVLYGRVVR